MHEGWWSSFFDSAYASVGLESKPADATLDLITGVLGVSPGDLVFDQCCGIGRVSIPLAQRGLRIIGVDQGSGYTATASSRATGLDCEFHAGDAFEFVAPRPCDGGINWFTSFGYDRDDRVNIKMLLRAHDSLRSGAKFAIEYVSIPRVLAEFRAVHLDKFGELWLIQEPSFDFAAGMISGNWTFLHPDGRREVRRVENRAYMPHELAGLFAQAGFTNIELLGPERLPFERTSRRCICVGTKP